MKRRSPQLATDRVEPERSAYKGGTRFDDDVVQQLVASSRIAQGLKASIDDPKLIAQLATLIALGSATNGASGPRR